MDRSRQGPREEKLLIEEYCNTVQMCVCGGRHSSATEQEIVGGCSRAFLCLPFLSLEKWKQRHCCHRPARTHMLGEEM
jgi:hypothetical protein